MKQTWHIFVIRITCNLRFSISVRCMFSFVLFENDNLIVIYFLGIEILVVISNDNYYYIFSVSLFFFPLKTILFNMIDVHFGCFHCQNFVYFLLKKQDLIFLKWRWCFILELSMWCYENCALSNIIFLFAKIGYTVLISKVWQFLGRSLGFSCLNWKISQNFLHLNWKISKILVHSLEYLEVEIYVLRIRQIS